jgi:lipopolysaccharide biosynthesis glycosyltransferase
MNKHCSIWLGWDPREADAYAVARHSIRRHLTQPIPIRGVVLDDLVDDGLYTRETYRDYNGSAYYDPISGAPMSTQHAIARFLVPTLWGHGYALFADGDILARMNLARLFDEADSSKAVQVVKHDYAPPPGTKMDGQEQTRYARKNWSSVMLFNCEHPANQELTVQLINAVPGRDLHRFCWLKDEEIGALDPAWNFLVGHTDASVDPKLVHFTEGGPWFDAYRDVPFADEWRAERSLWLNDEILAPLAA